MPGSVRFQIRLLVEGELGPAWSLAFGDLSAAPQPDGTTLVSGEVIDQAALHGLLDAIRDLGLGLIAVETTAVQPSTPTSGE